jgi:hypothetical protein
MPGHRKAHSLMQRGSLRRPGHGDAQLRTPDTQEGELLSQALALFFSGFPLLVGHFRFSRHARNLLLNRMLFQAHNHKLTPQSRSPLIGFNLFATGSLQQCGFLPDCLLLPGSVGSHCYGMCLHLSHLLLELQCLGHIPYQALHKNKTTTDGRRC